MQAILTLCLPALTPFWLVKTEKTTTFLGGTFHVLRTSDFPSQQVHLALTPALR
jgi:hypothetical protein